jgi:hypothetical protein
MGPVTFGKISREEADMKSYPKDPLADAVVLFDIGKTRFLNNDGSFNIEFEKTIRIKIFKQSAFSYAEVEIPYYYEGNSTEKINSIEAYTYNVVEGNVLITRLDPVNIFDEKLNSYWRVKKFAFPNVREGSVIEYRYVLSSPFLWNLRDWEFQHKIPTIYSNYIVRIIPFYEYSYILQGMSKFSSQKDWIDEQSEQSIAGIKYKELVHEYTMVDIPAFKSEDYITTINDYIIKIDFQLSKIHTINGAEIDVVKTWPALIKELDTHESFGKYVNKAERAAPKIINIKSYSVLPPRQRFDTIVKYVKRNYNWNGYEGKYANDPINKFLEQKKGNTGNINLLLTGLLSASGLDAYPLILSTRDNGKIKDIPFLDFFNYVVAAAYINDTLVLADATETFTPSDALPIRSLNDKGLLIKRDEVKWQPLAVNEPSILKSTFDIHFSAESDTLDALLTTEATGYQALIQRKRYYNEKNKLIEDCTSSGYTVESDSIAIDKMTAPESPLMIKIPLKMETERVGNRILISPFLKEPISKNKLVENSRTYPIDFIYPEDYQFKSKIYIPANCKVISLPAEAKINNDAFLLTYNAITDGSVVTVTGEYSFKKPVYKPADYNIVRYYFNEIIKDMNRQIVVEVN